MLLTISNVASWAHSDISGDATIQSLSERSGHSASRAYRGPYEYVPSS